MTYPEFERDIPLQVGEAGVLQHLNRFALNGLIAIVTGELKQRLLYNLTNPADSEVCLAYKVRIPGYPTANERIEWCVKAFQLRRIEGPGEARVIVRARPRDFHQTVTV